jgi:hypothetical protein
MSKTVWRVAALFSQHRLNKEAPVHAGADETSTTAPTVPTKTIWARRKMQWKYETESGD